MLFGDQIAVYGDGDDGLGDHKEGTPSRASGFIGADREDDVLDVRVTALLSADPALRVRHFAGTFPCRKCGVRGPIEAV